ncbi:MAG: TlpA disulfide reductase family protein [Bacteroidota bacterium]|nr:TlpA disulfide reductase family protein [Bacteroidota bacterium]
MKQAAILLFLFLAATSVSSAQSSIISGNAKSYAGDSLVLCEYSDYITKQKQLVSKTLVRESGEFQFELPLNKTRLLFIQLGVFEGLIYLQPQDSLRIILPIKTEMSKSDSLNPYFTKQQHYLRDIAHEYSLTNAVMKFEKLYSTEMKHLFSDYSGRINSLKTDSAVQRIKSKTAAIDSEFFKYYQYYRFTAMRHAAYNRNTKSILKKHFVQKPIRYNNPAYGDALNITVKNIFSKKEIFTLTNKFASQEACNEFYKLLENKIPALKHQIKEYILLQNIYHAAFKYNMDKQRIAEMINHIYNNTYFKEHRSAAKNIFNELSELQNGDPAPNFSLQRADGSKLNLDELNGKFVYLNFFSPESYTGKKELALLEGLHHENLPNFAIVSIYRGKTFSEFQSFMKHKTFKFEFLYANSETLLEQYRVMTFPAYYLINPEGRVVLMSAPSPAERIKPVYGKFYTEWHREQVRKQSKNNNSLIND